MNAEVMAFVYVTLVLVIGAVVNVVFWPDILKAVGIGLGLAIMVFGLTIPFVDAVEDGESDG